MHRPPATLRHLAMAVAVVTAATLGAACSSGSSGETRPTSVPQPTTTSAAPVPSTTAAPAPTTTPAPSAPTTAPAPIGTGEVQHGPIDPGMTRSGETVITAIPALMPIDP